MKKKEIGNASIKAVVDTFMAATPITNLFHNFFKQLEYGAEKKVRDEWEILIENKLIKLETRLDELVDSEFFMSCIKLTTVSALRTFQEEKRIFLANALYNSAVSEDIDRNKINLALTFIDKYPVVVLRVLDLFSHTNKPKNNHDVHAYISKYVPEAVGVGTEAIMKMLLNDGLIVADQFNLMKYSSFHQIRVTGMGDTILNLIKN